LELAETKFEEALWHEFAGHSMSPEPIEAQHPIGEGNEWNRYDEGFKDPKTRNPQWGKKFDYAIIQENKARKVLGKSMRAPWYYGLPKREGID
jgi:hypothetical protein